jgi:hypothetical protein
MEKPKPETVAQFRNRLLTDAEDRRRTLGPWMPLDDIARCECKRYPSETHPKGNLWGRPLAVALISSNPLTATTVLDEKAGMRNLCLYAHSEEEKASEDDRARKNGWILLDR